MCAAKAVGNLSRSGMQAYEQGDILGAQFLLHQALLQARGLGSSILEARVLNNIGLVAAMSGQKPKAVSSLEEALRKIREKAGDENRLYHVVERNLEQARNLQ